MALNASFPSSTLRPACPRDRCGAGAGADGSCLACVNPGPRAPHCTARQRRRAATAVHAAVAPASRREEGGRLAVSAPESLRVGSAFFAAPGPPWPAGGDAQHHLDRLFSLPLSLLAVQASPERPRKGSASSDAPPPPPGSETARPPPGPPPGGEPGGCGKGPGGGRSTDYYANVGHAVRTLREELPCLFQRDLSYDIYRADIAFRDPRNLLLGLDKYKLLFWSLRFHGALFFSRLRVDIRRVWQPKEATISVRWAVVGVPRVPWEAEGVFEGTSEYKLDREGLIYEHVVDNVILSTPTLAPLPLLQPWAGQTVTPTCGFGFDDGPGGDGLESPAISHGLESLPPARPAADRPGARLARVLFAHFSFVRLYASALSPPRLLAAIARACGGPGRGPSPNT